MGKLRVYCLKTLNKLSIYSLGNTPSAPSEIDRAESELEYADESLDHTSYFEPYAEPSMPEQATPERPTDVPIVVLTPPINATFPCCPGCKVLNEPVTELVPIHWGQRGCYPGGKLRVF